MKIKRRPRSYAYRGGYKLTVFRDRNGWQVAYVSSVDVHGNYWAVPHPRTTMGYNIDPFPSWEAAFAHATTLRTFYADECRGDYTIWNRIHPDRRLP